MVRIFELIHTSDKCDVWKIEWPPGTGLDWHDHGKSDAQVYVVEGVLDEWIKSRYSTGEVRSSFEAGMSFRRKRRTKHKVVNNGPVAAVSIHIYRPPLAVEYPEALEIG